MTLLPELQVLDYAATRYSSAFNRRMGGLRIWLGGLDSNQDNQIQNLMYCRLYDLPAGGEKNAAGRQAILRASPADISTLFMNCNSVNRVRNEEPPESKCLCEL